MFEIVVNVLAVIGLLAIAAVVWALWDIHRKPKVDPIVAPEGHPWAGPEHEWRPKK